MFLYRLATVVGEWNVEQGADSLSARMTLGQLAEWMAYYRIEPFGQDWWRSARHAATLGAVWTGKFNEEIEQTFMPTFRPDRPQTEAEMMAEMAKVPERYRKR